MTAILRRGSVIVVAGWCGVTGRAGIPTPKINITSVMLLESPNNALPITVEGVLSISAEFQKKGDLHLISLNSFKPSGDTMTSRSSALKGNLAIGGGCRQV